MDFSTFNVSQNLSSTGAISVTLPQYLGTLVIILVGALTMGVSFGFNFVRKRFHNDGDNVDVAFDAGGKVSIGLTATTIVSQWTWAATLLQSCSVATKYGISGPFWYAAGATVQILLFAALSAKLKTRAPGGKTFTQIIQARFGPRAHKVYCGYALLTNLVVTAMLMLGGAEVVIALIDGVSVEIATLLCTAIIFGYTMVGGLGATFYVSYFNSALIFVGMFIYCYHIYFAAAEQTALGSIDNVYKLIDELTGPPGNAEGSFLTMLSKQGLMFGIINLIGNFGTVFVDQSYWQSSVAAKPKEGVFGFLLGGLVWFSVPFTFATTMGLGYLALNSEQGSSILTETQVNAGLVPVAVAGRIGGYSTMIILLIMILMAMESTGSAEVVAVSSILVYDIYKIYIKPFKQNMDPSRCPLCDKLKHKSHFDKAETCDCTSMEHCDDCKRDEMLRNMVDRAVKPVFQCKTHGDYRRYNQILGDLKNWCLLWSSLAIIPLTLILKASGITLGWLYLFMGVLIGSAVIPVGVTLFWSGLTANAVTIGPLCGTGLGLTVWLAVASTFEGGLGNFFRSTGEETAMLAGNVVSLGMGGLIAICISLWEKRNSERKSKSQIWASTFDIDNPLSPWTALYKKELRLTMSTKINVNPDINDVENRFKSALRTAWTGSLVCTIILLIAWPSLTCIAGVFDLTQFHIWVVLSIAWGGIGGLLIIILPVVGEIKASWDAYKEKRASKLLNSWLSVGKEMKNLADIHPNNGSATESSSN